MLNRMNRKNQTIKKRFPILFTTLHLPRFPVPMDRIMVNDY